MEITQSSILTKNEMSPQMRTKRHQALPGTDYVITTANLNEEKMRAYLFSHSVNAHLHLDFVHFDRLYTNCSLFYLQSVPAVSHIFPLFLIIITSICK